MPERSHLSIGEVLSLLRDEFPDVTISKIRFLESQGLVDPERTPSGYRKFYEHDVERLRWILRQQREHFLPLKIIRGRLEEQGSGQPVDGPLTPEEASAVPVGREPEPPDGRIPDRDGVPAAAGPADLSAAERSPTTVATPAPSDISPAARSHSAPRPSGGGGRTPAPIPSLFAGLHAEGGETGPGGAATGSEEPTVRPDADPPAPGRPGADPPAPGRPAPGRPAGPSGAEPGPGRPGGRSMAVPAATPVTAGGSAVAATAARPGPDDTGAGEGTETFTAEELAAAVGTEVATVHELEQYGLIAPHGVVAGVPYYDHPALAVVLAAARFARHGVEARHLRVWRNSAEREADLYQQVVLPLLRQRNPQARRQALDTLEELATTGAALRAALVERAVRDIR